MYPQIETYIKVQYKSQLGTGKYYVFLTSKIDLLK